MQVIGGSFPCGFETWRLACERGVASDFICFEALSVVHSSADGGDCTDWPAGLFCTTLPLGATMALVVV